MEGILRQIRRLPFGKLLIKESAAEITRAKEEKKRAAFFAELEEVREQIRAVQSAFDAETDFDLIDTYTLELCALEQRYSYLIKRAKKEHITAF